MKLITRYVCPPVESRAHDWVAYWEGQEQAACYGKTELAATEALLEQEREDAS